MMSASEKIKSALQRLRDGKMIIIVDDEDRENEGDLCMLAELAKAEDINFMAKYGRGLICLTMTEERMKKLKLNPMVNDNTSRFQTAFTVSIEAKSGVTTGISAADRAHTIRTAAALNTTAADLARPGHIFPITARNGGVLTRVGQTEGSVDLARLAGAAVPAGVICEIMNDDGTMARMPELLKFSQQHDIPIITIAELISYRLRFECHVVTKHSCLLTNGKAKGFHAIILENTIDHSQHLALTLGEIDKQDDQSSDEIQNHDKLPVVRVHRAQPLHDLLDLQNPNTPYRTLEESLQHIRQHECGVLLYLNIDHNDTSTNTLLDELRNISQAENQKNPTTLQNNIEITHALNNAVTPRTRMYGLGAQCLRQLGITRMIYLSDTPRQLIGLEAFGLEIVEYLHF